MSVILNNITNKKKGLIENVLDLMDSDNYISDRKFNQIVHELELDDDVAFDTILNSIDPVFNRNRGDGFTAEIK